MKRLRNLALALTAALCTGTVAAQGAVIDFHGESTFRGYYSGVEHDNPVTLTSNPIQNFATGPDTADNGWYANTPRRTVERLIAAGNSVAPYNASRANFSVSATPLSNFLSGQTGNNGKPIEVLSGGTDGAIAVINTGLNDALLWSTAKATFQSDMKEAVERLLRTGKKVVILRPNSTNNPTANTTLNNYFSDLSSYLYGRNSTLFDSTNVRLVTTSISADPAVSNPGGTTRKGDGTHPDNYGYDSMAGSLASAITQSPSFLTNASNERKVAQNYILFFNRAVESGGASYWLDKLNQNNEAYVTLAMFNAAPEYKNLSTDQIVEKWYWNLFRLLPDDDGRLYWIGRINAVGVGPAAVEMLEIVRKYGYNEGDINQGNGIGTTAAQATHKKLLVHRTNVGVAYGFRLKRSTVDTSGMMSTITVDPASVYAATKNLQ